MGEKTGLKRLKYFTECPTVRRGRVGTKIRSSEVSPEFLPLTLHVTNSASPVLSEEMSRNKWEVIRAKKNDLPLYIFIYILIFILILLA